MNLRILEPPMVSGPSFPSDVHAPLGVFKRFVWAFSAAKPFNAAAANDLSTGCAEKTLLAIGGEKRCDGGRPEPCSQNV
jgi:hypothetical protein